MNSPFSWPEISTIYYLCKKCQKGNHIRFEARAYGQIKMVGGMDGGWEQINKYTEASLDIREDPGFLHVWLKTKHYEIKARV
ncbi:MAG: hypothetical protein H0W44_02495 [Gammaproteobacteria bacterium]|nr:hypothetical protein [Gammaproteobacteria bacterium]